MYDKTWIYRIGAVCLCAAVAAAVLYAGFSSRGDSDGAAEQINRAADLNRQAGAEVDAAAGAVGRAEQYAEQAAELNQSAQAGADDCGKLVEQLQADNRRAKRILDELISNAQTGAAAGTEN